eukprot:TRINITY_DN8798_c0_g1_i4.p1 TRINITY_DN8798_c0_g1~~TRINITY_DN8798_c0_g1_i4.p1  ORF type:complete len:150 (-),score=55.85 TRINITY_DN8798_c0_g1_i4:34-483(-)
MKESKKGAESVEDQRVIEELKKLDTITKTQQQTNDDIVLNHLRSMDLRFQNTEVRKRQHTCLAKDVPVDQLPNFSQSVTLGSLRLGLKAILEMDKEDKSLERYKKSLLGESEQSDIREGEPPEVEFVKIEIITPGRPGGNIILDFEVKN